VAHTLKAYYYTDPATAVTVDFMGAIAANSGIALDSYEMGIPGVEQARNNSLYSDSPRPVYSKHGTVTDVLSVTVRGSTNTALYTNLHYLVKLGEYARTAQENPDETLLAYLELKPGGSAAGEVLYAAIYDCRVQLPADWANVQDATKTIDDVTVTIERGLWRTNIPTSGLDVTNYSGTGKAFASSAVSSTAIGGDTEADFYLLFSHDSGSTTGQIDRAIIGFRSQALAYDNYDDCGKYEAEGLTNGTDTSDAADATASAGNKVECTFATTTNALRLSGAKIPYGVHRIFARMKITGSAVATVYAGYSDDTAAYGATVIANATVSVNSTSWLVYDLGIVRAFQFGFAQAQGYRGTIGIYALLASGAGNLDIDWIYCMPTEGYITIQGVGIGTSAPSSNYYVVTQNATQVPSCAVYSVNSLKVIQPRYTTSFRPKPGPVAIYWLMGTDSGDVFDVGIHASLTIQLFTLPRFLMPSEV
jgi:hypothetical protein